MKPIRSYRELNNLLDTIWDRFYLLQWSQQEFADAAGVCPQTVSRLGSKQTKFPHFQTVYLLGKAVGLTVSLAEPLVEATPKKLKKRSA